MNGPDDHPGDYGRQNRPETPRSEPEIIPPDRSARGDSRSHIWIWTADGDGIRRTAVPMPGPFTIFFALAVVALVTAVVLVVVLGAVLLWIPVLVVLVGALLLSAAVRQRWHQFRHWLARR